MNCCRKTAKMGVSARHVSKARRARRTAQVLAPRAEQPQGAGPD